MAGLTVIYVDTLFLLNAIVDYLLLLCSARLAGERLSRLRFALGALLGGLYAVALFLPGFGFLGRPLCRLSAAVLMVLTAFGGCRRLLRQVVIFFLLSCAFGGGVLAIGLLGGRGLSLGGRGALLLHGPEDRPALGSGVLCGHHPDLPGGGPPHRCLPGAAPRPSLPPGAAGGAHCPGGHGEHADRPGLRAAGDGGGGGDPVPPVPTGDRARAGGPAGPGGGGLARLGEGPLRGRLRLLPYRAVGVDRGLLLAVRVDRARVGGEELGPLLVAMSPTPVSDGGSYRALIGALT